MRLPKFEYLEPKSLKEAINALASDTKGSVLLAGGTDLLVNMKHRCIQPKQVINLKSIPKLAYISDGKNGLRIGALTTLHDLASSPIIQERYPVLCQAAKEVGAYAHQVMGTIGGNLCQGNRCRFYNQSAFWRSVRSLCYKAGGEDLSMSSESLRNAIPLIVAIWPLCSSPWILKSRSGTGWRTGLFL